MNDNEAKGAESRRRGESRPPVKSDSIWNSPADVQASIDKRLGWDREDARRRAQAKKRK